MEVCVTEMFKLFKRKLFDPDPGGGVTALMSAMITIVVAAIIGIYLWAYALKDVVTNSTLIGSTIGANLLSGLFVIVFFLAIALIPLSLLWKSLSSGTRGR
jgi:phosphate/sulfate permease